MRRPTRNAFARRRRTIIIGACFLFGCVVTTIDISNNVDPGSIAYLWTGMVSVMWLFYLTRRSG